MGDLEIRIHGSPSRCPYCKDSIGDVREIVACALCGARHHASCRAEHGRCAVCSSSERLVYQQTNEPRVAPGLNMAREDGALVYRWRLIGKVGLALIPKTAFVRLEVGTIVFTAAAGRTLFEVTAEKARVGPVVVSGRRLRIDVGENHYTLATESIGYALSPVELSILETAIREWK